jgi:hypothetical protein
LPSSAIIGSRFFGWLRFSSAQLVTEPSCERNVIVVPCTLHVPASRVLPQAAPSGFVLTVSPG